jgi:hypothetical protein
MTDNKNSFPHRINPDGTVNNTYVDVLDEDKPIAGQKFSCVSFISPEKIIKQREMYNFQQFLKQWDMNKSIEKFNQFLSFVSYKYNLNFDNISKDLQDFCKDEKESITASSVEDDFKNFIDMNDERLLEEFNKEHKFQTSVRGLKVRGSYPTQEEAEMRCKMLREVDPNHDVYVGPVGMWMPFHPESYKTGRVEYMEDELNQLMQEKTKNESSAKVEFDKRIKDSKVKAIEDNKKKALESGNVLTQTIDEEGNLVSVKDIDEYGKQKEISVADLRKELFEGDNVVTGKYSDHGLGNVAKVRELPTEMLDALKETEEKMAEEKTKNK